MSLVGSARYFRFLHCDSYFWLWVVLCLHTGLLAWSAVRQSPTVDEPMHLAGGLRRLCESRFDVDIGNPPLVGNLAAFPVSFLGVKREWRSIPDSHMIGGDFLEANGVRSCWLIIIGRLSCIPFSLLGCYICYRWSRDLYGPLAGLLSLSLFAFCPMILAHGQLITADVASAGLGVTAFYLLWKWMQSGSWLTAFACGVACGLTAITKYVWVIAYPVFPLVWLLCRPRAYEMEKPRSWWTECGHFALICFVCLDLINLSYHFEGALQPLGESRLAVRLKSILPEVLLSLPSPFPEPYLSGMDAVAADRDRRHWVYLGEHVQAGGYWYFYLYAMVFKLPIGTLSILSIAALLSLWRPSIFCRAWRDELVLIIPALSLLLFISVAATSQFDRYFIPILPFLFVLAGKTAMGLYAYRDSHALAVNSLPDVAAHQESISRGPLFGYDTPAYFSFRRVVMGAVAWSIISTLSVYPHTNSYFNGLAGGPTAGHRFLIDSSIDWGQDLLYLKEWQVAHPEVNDLHLSYFGRLDPRYVGLNYSLPPKVETRHPPSSCVMPGEGPQPGWHAISVSLLRGNYWEIVPGTNGAVRWLDQPYYKYFLDLKPVARAGYSINIYYIDQPLADRLRRKYGYPVDDADTSSSSPPKLVQAH